MSIDYGTGVESIAIRWDLAPVEILDVDAEELEVETACRRFAERYRGRIGSLGAEELAGALDELARIRSTLVRLTGAARLRLALNVNGAAERAAGARADAIAAGAEELLRFFELEWLALPDSRVEELCASPSLAHACHMFRPIRRVAPPLPPEARGPAPAR